MSAQQTVSPVQQSYRYAVATFDRVVRQLRPTDWDLPTPCADWTVRALINHVTGETCWTPPLLAGRAIDEIGDRFSGDLLGPEPLAAWDAAQQAAAVAVFDCPVEEVVVQTSAGPISAAEYLQQLIAEYVIHGWDLAAATGADTSLDTDLVAAVAGWFANHSDEYRTAGATSAAASVSADAGPQTRLLSAFGRDEQAALTSAAVARFGAAFDRQDVSAVMAAMTDDCIFESTGPPDGTRHRGQDAVSAAWSSFFQSSPNARFTTEEQFTCGDRAVVRWRYDFPTGHVRGVDVFRVRDGRVAEKLSYVKG